MGHTQTICPEFCQKGKGGMGWKLQGKWIKKGLTCFVGFVRTMRELTACVPADGKDLAGERENSVLPEIQGRHVLE